MGVMISRRRFFEGTVSALVAAKAHGKEKPLAVPTRVLGRTGVRTPVVGFGTGMSFWAALKEEHKGVEALNLALDAGITYIDTGQNYGDGLSETWVGKVLKHRRKEAMVATKIRVRDRDEALRETERSLKRLQTNHIDVIHIHSLDSLNDLAQIEAKGGLLEALYKLRDEKVVRFIGTSCHYDAVALRTALERHDFDCTQIALNPGLQGWGEKGPSSIPMSFETTALPVARRKDIGVIAMKVTARGALVGTGPGQADFPTLLRYALSLPISIAVIGMGNLKQILRNADLARNFRPMPKSTMEELSRRMAPVNEALLEHRFRHHQDS
jgi:aryl-alcohol dehydrogenase-like predicted oxidoreductase